MMRWLIASLGLLLLLLQYQIWLDEKGARSVHRLNQTLKLHAKENQELKERNSVLLAEIEDLKEGTDAIEEHARVDLGMKQQGEIFYKFVNEGEENNV